MKIQGNTIGTPIKPEKVIEKCGGAVLYTEQQLTTKQQEQARNNIRAVATVNNTVPDKNGNVIMCAFDSIYLGIDDYEQMIWIYTADPSTTEDGEPFGVLCFSHEKTGGFVRLTGIAEGVNSWDAATVGQLNTAVGDISTALAELRTYAQSLKGGESA